jgi:hypothetical protein
MLIGEPTTHCFTAKEFFGDEEVRVIQIEKRFSEDAFSKESVPVLFLI